MAFPLLRLQIKWRSILSWYKLWTYSSHPSCWDHWLGTKLIWYVRRLHELVSSNRKSSSKKNWRSALIQVSASFRTSVENSEAITFVWWRMNSANKMLLTYNARNLKNSYIMQIRIKVFEYMFNVRLFIIDKPTCWKCFNSWVLVICMTIAILIIYGLFKRYLVVFSHSVLW